MQAQLQGVFVVCVCPPTVVMSKFIPSPLGTTVVYKQVPLTSAHSNPNHIYLETNHIDSNGTYPVLGW